MDDELVGARQFVVGKSLAGGDRIIGERLARILERRGDEPSAFSKSPVYALLATDTGGTTSALAMKKCFVMEPV